MKSRRRPVSLLDCWQMLGNPEQPAIQAVCLSAMERSVKPDDSKGTIQYLRFEFFVSMQQQSFLQIS